MILAESHTATGYVDALVFDGPLPSMETIRSIVYDGADHERLVSHGQYKNRLNNNAVLGSAKLWVGEYVVLPTMIKLGTGTPTAPQTGPLTTDEDCWTPDNSTERTADVRSTFLSIYSEIGVTYEPAEAIGTWTEALLYDADGVAWAHSIITLVKTGAQTALILWRITHTGN